MKYKQDKEKTKLEDTITELQTTLSFVSHDKDRLFQNKLQMHQHIDDAMIDRENFSQV